ncbi:MAG: ammonium transporter [Pseudomonadota bacterium]|jgi:Amt family ammonium transporter|nr:ammonium transporter [Candidatus Neomarinimicrobiota bacterium]MEC9098152.1 ammonium transporter [Pseudomonadota bacterium]MED5253849.1 ammonium transporter [Pseudomonadota bacterium]MED5273186.1 ammonium transporter [Pseudomonadota bacterium]MED5484869.1 ammonium transporter [Pseudomonadota bacterium]|tara:strand:- start:368 stop:1576 length:1209 start_codon:yes stop_codon:yes gene_type:complete
MIDTGNTAWIITATALVLFMTLPGLALFYGGLVRSKNVLSVLMQCISVACLASVLWLVIGYSLAFGDGNQWIGDTSKMFLSGVGRDTLSGDIPETVFFAFQMTFAVITPALIVGAYVERIKFSAVLLFSGLWLLVVYAPVTHWIWAGNGWLYQAGLLDFAGGLVVHLTAGSSALVLAAMLGPRSTFPLQVDPPHNPAMVMIGASMLWVGWFGFNAGSALAADGNAGMALVVTHISAATASLVWMIMDWSKFGKPTLIGLVTGTIAGLASITPASGSVGPIGALIIGGSAGIICYLFVNIVKNKLRIDDSLDVFAVHGIGGLLGILLVAFLVDSNIGGAGYAEGLNAISQLLIQLKGTVAVLVLSVVASIIIIYVVKFTVGLRVDESSEVEGLDISSHGETNG